MGRKKRKSGVDATALEATGSESGQKPAEQKKVSIVPASKTAQPAVVDASDAEKDTKAPVSSGYAVTSHSGEIIDEDIYVSDGSDDDDEDEIEMVLVGSRMGIMRRGIHHPMLVQPNRQWVRQEAGADQAEQGEDAEQKRLKEQEEELAKLDPAQRAARLLAEKQRKLEEAKENARRLESEENAGRDPCLFSKRTAFDIRFDQIDDKPWTRGAGDLTDFFNYGLSEEDWMEYSQQQLMIRQELTDASRQRRPPDPTLVPVTPRTPNKQTPKVAVASSSNADENDGTLAATGDEDGPVVGPVLVKKEETSVKVVKSEGPDKAELAVDVHVGSGGAWGAGAAPGSVLARLIEEQERKEADGGSKRDDPAPEKQSRSHDMEVDHYGAPNMNSGSHDNRGWNQDNQNHPDWNDQGHHGYQGHPDWNNQAPPGPPDRNMHGNHFPPEPNHYHNPHRGGRGMPPHFGGRGGRGGRGFNPHHGGRGRGRPFPPGPPQPWGGRGDHPRKRQRDDYDNKRWRR